MVKPEPEFEKIAQGPDCVFCVSAELLLPEKGEPVLSVLPSVVTDEPEADEDGFLLAAKRSASIMERLGFDPEITVFDTTEYVSSSVTEHMLPACGADIRPLPSYTSPTGRRTGSFPCTVRSLHSRRSRNAFCLRRKSS